MTDSKDIKWQAEFIKTIVNPSVGNVDMYLVNNATDGFTAITLGVPEGDKETPLLICESVNTHAQMKARIEELQITLLNAPVFLEGGSKWEFADRCIRWSEERYRALSATLDREG